MKALESQQMQKATAGEDKEKMERFDGGEEGNSRAISASVRGSYPPHTSRSALIAGTVGTVIKKSFEQGFLVEMRLMLMETSFQIYAAAQGKHKDTLLEI